MAAVAALLRHRGVRARFSAVGQALIAHLLLDEAFLPDIDVFIAHGGFSPAEDTQQRFTAGKLHVLVSRRGECWVDRLPLAALVAREQLKLRGSGWPGLRGRPNSRVDNVRLYGRIVSSGAGRRNNSPVATKPFSDFRRRFPKQLRGYHSVNETAALHRPPTGELICGPQLHPRFRLHPGWSLDGGLEPTEPARVLGTLRIGAAGRRTRHRSSWRQNKREQSA